MKKVMISLLVVFIAGCTSTSEKRAKVAVQESSRLVPPSQRLSLYSNFELEALDMASAVRNDAKKMKVAGQLEEKLRTKLLPLLEKWNSNWGGGDAQSTLLVRPKVASLHVVSGGARFWAGAWAGNSSIDLDLTLVDGDTGSVIANPRINRAASAVGGAWSVGATDRNLLDYITDISYQYLLDHY